MARIIGVLGSTGSIGTQALQVIREMNGREENPANPHFDVKVLTCGHNRELLLSQALEFGAEILCVESEADADWLTAQLKLAAPDREVTVLWGEEGLVHAAGADLDVALIAVVGMRGLRPTLAAIEAGSDVALANKETLVAAGEAVMDLARERGVKIFPVDSEHSAIFQCLRSTGFDRRKELEKIILTCSGGPFRTWSKEALDKVTVADALAHPTWKMGNKITVDCATLMNKGLEVIEAMRLFHVGPDKIEVNIHPQSIIHSMVRYRDGCVIAQLGLPDMKVPIQVALTYPYRGFSETPRLDLTEIGALTFEKPRLDAFPCLGLAYSAAKEGGVLPAVMNGANEVCVYAFLTGRLGFSQIPEMISRTMDAFLKECGNKPVDRGLETVYEADGWARTYVHSELDV